MFLAAAGLAVLAVVVYRLPAWLELWTGVGVAARCAVGLAVSAALIGASLRAGARTARRLSIELVLLGCALLSAEAVLVAYSPDARTDHPRAQRMLAGMRAAAKQGIEYDSRLRADLARALQSRGVDAMPGVSQDMAHPDVTAGVRERRLLPLSGASNAHIVECNEGPGFLEFRSDELGFNNPPGLASADIDIAVIGESLALGHCVPASKSAVSLLRAGYPRTANFGIAGSRVLSQLGVFREYVERLEPSFVVWFVNSHFAEPGAETERPILLEYLSDSAFSQGLAERQDEIDAFVREVIVPLNLAQDDALRAELERAQRWPWASWLKLREIRRLVDFGRAVRLPEPDLTYFARAVDAVANRAREWGGELVVVILPSFGLATDQPYSVARYEGVREILAELDVGVVDGAALFRAQRDPLGLFTLRTDNHPNEEGHALLADAVAAALGRQTQLSSAAPADAPSFERQVL